MISWQSDRAIAPEETFELCATVDIPLLGVVAAGQPYEAFAVEESLTVPTALWGGKQVFALRVRGDSMIDEGIQNGDFIIVEPRAVAENGQTVVAEIDGCVTVKKYYREAGGQVRLQPANPEMLPLVVRGESVRVIGLVAGVLRKFGFGEKRAASSAADLRPTPPPASRRRKSAPSALDVESMDLAVNGIDSQLARWNAAIAKAGQERRLRRHVPQMAELGRDLQSLRDWCSRTRKPGLRRALIEEANRIMRRMQRFNSVTPVRLPDLTLH